MSVAPVHAGLAACRTVNGWQGVLVRGRSGAGKSDLTLRLIALGWRLVADDRVVIWTSAKRVWGRAAPALQDLLEIRSVGVVAAPALAFAVVRVVVDCVDPDVVLDRVPVLQSVDVCGVAVPQLVINPFEISAAHKIQAYCGSLRL